MAVLASHHNTDPRNLSLVALGVKLPVTAGATGQQSSRIKWQALLEFIISGLTFTNIFLVVKNLSRPVVLGIDWLNQINAVLDFEQSTLSVTVQGERHTISFHADAFVSEVALPITSIGRMPPSELTLPFDLSTTITPLSGLCEKAESVTTLSREKRDQQYRALRPTRSSLTNYRAARTNTSMTSKCTTRHRS
jgi:hypothetical protein